MKSQDPGSNPGVYRYARNADNTMGPSMVEMTRAARVPSIGPEYNTFLYATIGAEANGTSLSVLSAMARMNLDPWQEAASLAELPGKAAARRLAALIAALPSGQSAPDEPGTIAARLVKLLPQQGQTSLPLPQQSRVGVPPFLLGFIKASSSKIAIYVIVVLIALTLGAEWFVANRPPSGNATNVPATTAPQSTPPGH